MVVLQFVFSIALLIASTVILREFRAMKDADPGFESKGVALARLDFPEVESTFPAAQRAIGAVPGVLGVSASSFAAWKDGDLVRDYPLAVMGKMKYCDVMVVDREFLRVQGVKLAAGRDFSGEEDLYGSDEVIMNETAMKRYGFTLGQFLVMGQLRARIVGVAKDFFYSFPSRKAKPLLMVAHSPFMINNAFGSRPVHLNRMLIKLAPGREMEALAEAGRIWRSFARGYSFDYEFEDVALRSQLDDYYFSFEGVLGLSTALAFLLSGLGLFGLASFEIERRTKEVGIRKALGATSTQIVLHFLAGFSALIAIANLIAWPVTFVLLRFIFTMIQYPRPLLIGPLVFLEACAVSFLVMVATVGAQTLRAARANPVNTIRYE